MTDTGGTRIPSCTLNPRDRAQQLGQCFLFHTKGHSGVIFSVLMTNLQPLHSLTVPQLTVGIFVCAAPLIYVNKHRSSEYRFLVHHSHRAYDVVFLRTLTVFVVNTG